MHAIGDMSEPAITEVIYRSWTHEIKGWDVVQAIYRYQDVAGSKRTSHSFVIARAADGTILRKTDIIYDRWEIVTDESDQRDFRSVFNNRDKAALAETPIITPP